MLDQDQIPSDLLPHLRYPEDMFKVQRFQYARYHVTDPNDFFNANNQWQVSPDAVAQGAEPGADPDVHPRPGDRARDLVADVELRAEQQDQPVRLRHRRLRPDAHPTTGRSPSSSRSSDNLPGPAQAYSQLISDPQITRKTQSFRLGDATPQYGNVVSVPLGSGLMYVVPVYATRQQTAPSSYLTLRYVMVSYGTKVGIGDTLVDAITDMAGTTPPPDTGNGNGNNNGGPPPSPSRGAMAKAHAHASRRPRRDFAAADHALAEGKGARVGTPQPPGPRRGRQGPEPAEVATPAPI